MYPSRVYAPVPSTPSAEDFFASALSNLFTDDPQTHHGVPGQSVYYDSPRFGRISLRIPEHPDAEEGRQLFAYNLWNGGVVAADAIEEASNDTQTQSQSQTSQKSHEENHNVKWTTRYWSVRGKSILELGAGAALPSIIAALSGAKSVVISDHPSSTALTMGAIEQNIHDNLHVTTQESNPSTSVNINANSNKLLEKPAFQTTALHTSVQDQEQTPLPDVSPPPTKKETESLISIYGYTWGTTTFYLPKAHGKPVPDQPSSFQRIIIAECLWMHEQHANICKTILAYLPHDDPDGEPSCALFVASFPNGREVVRRFFEVATGECTIAHHDVQTDDDEDEETRSVKGKLKAVEMFEIDMNGARRAWAPRRPGEDKYMANRWCVCAVLIRR